MGFSELLAKMMRAPKMVGAEGIAAMLANDDPCAWQDAFAAAREIKERCGRSILLKRALIETSNRCAKDCLYCGIRKSNSSVCRYALSESETRRLIDLARERGYNAVAFQAGELEGETNTAYYERLLDYCRGLEVTLSLGEQDEAVYARWKAAGALRYLLRIESANRELYARLHPQTCSFDRRVSCIRSLKQLGYITGSGVMIGLPSQTIADLANDVVFFGEERLDMIGMGPYIPHPGTPLGRDAAETNLNRSLELSLRMIALVRLYLWNVNIVAATALEAIDHESGRERGIGAGANVIMDSITPDDFRGDYDLYPGKAVAR